MSEVPLYLIYPGTASSRFYAPTPRSEQPVRLHKPDGMLWCCQVSIPKESPTSRHRIQRGRAKTGTRMISSAPITTSSINAAEVTNGTAKHRTAPMYWTKAKTKTRQTSSTESCPPSSRPGSFSLRTLPFAKSKPFFAPPVLSTKVRFSILRSTRRLGFSSKDHFPVSRPAIIALLMDLDLCRRISCPSMALV